MMAWVVLRHGHPGVDRVQQGLDLFAPVGTKFLQYGFVVSEQVGQGQATFIKCLSQCSGQLLVGIDI